MTLNTKVPNHDTHPNEGQILKLPEEWGSQSIEVASFRYRVPKLKPDDPNEEAYVKIL
jgi:hypothetical protein